MSVTSAKIRYKNLSPFFVTMEVHSYGLGLTTKCFHNKCSMTCQI